MLMLMLDSVRPQLRLFKSLASSAQRTDGNREKTGKLTGPEPAAAGSRIPEGITHFIRSSVQIFGEMITLVVTKVLALIVDWLQMQLIDLN